MPDEFLFSNDFQDLIIACMIRHPGKFFDAPLVLKPKYFQGSQASITARCALSYFEKYSRFPSWQTLGQLVADETHNMAGLSEPEKAQEYVRKLSELKTGDVEFVREKIVSFARERATIGAIKEAILKLQSKKPVPDSEFVKMFEDALAVGKNAEDLGYVFHEDWEKVLSKITKFDYGVRTGYPMFDQLWKTGWAPGWLVVILAPPKRFKSTFSLNLALNMVGEQQHETVFYYACEISSELTVARALCNISGKGMNYLFDKKDQFIKECRKEMGLKIGGHLIIKGFPSKSVTMHDIRAHAKQVMTTYGIQPKAIIVDYAETVRPSVSGNNVSEHRSSAQVYTDARALAAELKCCVIMPDRCNKEAVAMKVPNMSSFQGSFEKAGIVDAAIGLCSTDTEYEMNEIRYFVFLNRHGKAYQHWKGKVDPETFKMTIAEEIPFDAAIFEEPAPRRSGRRRRDDGVAENLPDDITH